MKKVGTPNSITKNLIFSLAFSLSLSLFSFSQEKVAAPAVTAATPVDATAPAAGAGDPAKGKEIFNANCAACHKLDAKMTGPALRNVGAKYDKEWLYKWIANSQALIKSGDAQANAVWNEYKPSVMNNFPQLSKGDIDNVIAYASEPIAVIAPPIQPIGGSGTEVSSGGVSNNLILGALGLVMAILVLMLFLVNNVLTKIAKQNGIEVEKIEKVATTPIWVAFAKNQFLVLVSSITMILMGAYFAYSFMMNIGIDQDYEPIQPIHYSHRIHAGSNKIECKYCHSSAQVSKHSGIPSLNVCMNCHKQIAEVSDTTATADYSKSFYDGEIKKLYKAVGWDPATQKYTGKTEPVKWVRIHNLPDFVYFNHSQHVTVAKIECQTCHGPVQTYEIMKQYSKLTMGWCINCHRETEVKMDGNEYYTKIHEELSKKYGVEKLTAAQMGGLECGKCHY
jgi:mono/diheme cytochrome c family protein